ncbi:hypothetical protein E2320_017677 [Naja naja]|nr:hypothetical protein E2320_017677 [Naja naja]
MHELESGPSAAPNLMDATTRNVMGKFLSPKTHTIALVPSESERGGRSLFDWILAIRVINNCSFRRFAGGRRRQEICKASATIP